MSDGTPPDRDLNRRPDRDTRREPATHPGRRPDRGPQGDAGRRPGAWLATASGDRADPSPGPSRSDPLFPDGALPAPTGGPPVPTSPARPSGPVAPDASAQTPDPSSARPAPSHPAASHPSPSPAPDQRPAQPAAPDPPSGVDLARVALRAAKDEARARGALAQQKKQARRGGLRSGARADGRDPVPLGSAINRLISDRAWETPAAVGGVMGRWPQIVGDDLAHHCTPLSYDDDPDQRVLTVQCDSTAWATQVRLLAPQLLARLNKDLGQGTVKRIKVLGPHAPARRFGPLRAPGSRGPGDTYG